MKRILIAYYSWSGNTAAVADAIGEKTGGDLFRIEGAAPYPAVYSDATRVAKREQRENARPALAGYVEDMDRYDTVILGYPNWWGTMPMVVFSFLEAYDLTGKDILPFCTHGGGGIGRSEADIKKLCPGAGIGKGLAISGGRADRSADDIDRWLRNI